MSPQPPLLVSDDGVLKIFVLDDRTGLRVVRVADGQTATIHTSPEIMERVRVFGLNAWHGPEPMSDEARAFARHLLQATRLLLSPDRSVRFPG